MTSHSAASRLSGYLFAILSGVLFGINPSFRIIASNAGMSSPAIVFLSMAVGALAAFVFCVIRHRLPRLSPLKSLKLMGIGAIGMGVTGILLTLSYRFIPSGCSTVIHFMYPTLVCVASAILFRQRFTWKKALAVVLSITGVFLISGAIMADSVTGILIALLSGITFGSYSIVLEHDPDCAGLSSAQKMPYFMGGAALVSLLMCLITRNFGTFTATALLGSAVSGFCELFATLLFVLGISRIGSVPVGFCSLFEPITCVVVGVLFRGEPMTAVIACGIVLALSAVLVTVWDGMKKA